MAKLFELHQLTFNKDATDILSEIYKLRVKCWAETGFFDEKDYPDGWSDALDKSAQHFYIEINGEKASAARLNIVDSIKDIPIYKVYEGYGYDNVGNASYISRNVVLPEFRGLGLSKVMDLVRLNYLKRNGIQYCFADANQTRMETLLSYGFKILGRIAQDAPENYKKDPDTYVMIKEFLKNSN